ncbi:MAG: nucleotidyltransferase domain-containing protein [Salinarimonas sp.]
MDDAQSRATARRGSSRLDRILAARAAARERTARARVPALVDPLADAPGEVGVIGSLVRGRFGPHSDVDLLVRGPVDTPLRVRIEQAAATALRDPGLPYDLIHACDLTPERLEGFADDYLQPSRLREAWREVTA